MGTLTYRVRLQVYKEHLIELCNVSYVKPCIFLFFSETSSSFQEVLYWTIMLQTLIDWHKISKSFNSSLFKIYFIVKKPFLYLYCKYCLNPFQEPFNFTGLYYFITLPPSIKRPPTEAHTHSTYTHSTATMYCTVRLTNFFSCEHRGLCKVLVVFNLKKPSKCL